MESAGEQALLIGVNVFILVMALTSAILLMTTVLNMSDVANTKIKTNSDSSLMALYGETNERIYTGEQVLAIINGYFSETSNMSERFVLKIDDDEVQKDKFTVDKLESTYKLQYCGKDSEDQDKCIYNFKKI